MISKKNIKIKRFIEDHGIKAIAMHGDSIMCVCPCSYGDDEVKLISGDMKSARDYLGY